MFPKLLVAACAFSCVATAALAQDKPRPSRKPVTVAQSDSWSGIYIGAVVGGAIGRSSATNVVDCPATGFLCDPTHYPENGALLSATASGSKSDAAFTGGVLAGYNWRAERVVYGVETDVSYLHLRLTNGGRAASLNPGLNNGGAPIVPVVATVGTTAGMNWLATFRGRVGFLASPDVLVFATGGLALTNQSVSYSYVDDWIFNGGGVGSSAANSIAAGYAAGAGVEWRLSRSWGWKAEYLHAGFGTRTTSGFIYVVQVPAARNSYTSSANLAADLFRTGVAYKF